MRARPAVKPLPLALNSPSKLQNSCGLKASISRSRSQISRTATLCTRPADEPRFDLAPHQRTDLIAHQPVEHAARLLRVDAVHVDLARVLERFLHRLLGHFVELDALDRAS